MSAPAPTERLPLSEKIGYSCADAAANLVFMAMVVFQTSFYTDVFGLALNSAANVVLIARLWDAVWDPIMGVIADRTKTRWGRFRPWILWTAVPWAAAMIAAYTTPDFENKDTMFYYALVTNVLLMTLYSMNNMPYAALGGVMTADVDERTALNSYRFIAVNVAQLMVVGLTLPLVAKFAGASNDRQHGWQVTMAIYAALCLGLFLITFLTTRERVEPPPKQQTTAKQDFADLFANRPWLVMFLMTLAHFAILSMRGGAMYQYYQNVADKPALYAWLQNFGLDRVSPDSLLGWLGYSAKADLSNAADVANSLIGVVDKVVTIAVILLTVKLAKKFGKKTVAVAGFALATVAQASFYLVSPTNVWGMLGVTVLVAAVYAPTISLVWAIYADVADYSEWKTGRRATGMVFATICFALKAGLSLGGYFQLKIMESSGYVSGQLHTPVSLDAIHRTCSVYVAILFALCTALLIAYQINKNLTLQIAADLAERRKKLATG
jgi:GPH family glycoside/pentoside/hexuronide:cation symporter